MPLGQLPETAKEALTLWDSDQPVYTLEMGKQGPSHEQAIHIAIFELLRLVLSKGLPKDLNKASTSLDSYLALIDQTKQLKLSGTQAGAAKHLAFLMFKMGFKQTVDSHKNLKKIQVTRWFPKA